MQSQVYNVSNFSWWVPPTAGTILLVEDDLAILESLATILRDDGFRVYEASNGLEALGVLLNGNLKPDLIFLDMVMPLMDGTEFLAALEKQALWKDIPVALLSATRTESSSPMVVANMSKPVEIDEILALAHQHATHQLDTLAPPALRLSC